ncbi:hypothetical protein COT96_00745 [Candidatus Falkowbacteria bacterium CG10_big_fil_rev_8_21_14_0_10_38_22]|uniref:Uncharacterized protein n=1 Tax=Candidatus Falkowbacteria bacterium CG10_big_fil_rev_8_21_14_0_10_38_22 TaxID=1974564 RepID=A0A2M6WRZ3_9BACT|nr:hypothetical protein [Candidatus Kuenenbacteria bacterium]PIT95534.1 MAG: hypothetical protein COT96_00745 [Candidatus Falkowbacteria bacterium CG10_big_fil_rev_8_21_14_0_10_38_22]
MKKREKELTGAPISSIDFGQKRPMLKDRINERSKIESSGRKNKPKTSPPKDAIGRRKRLKNFMDWDIRGMDESVRSVIENNGQLLVINNLFSGYKEAKGNDLYIMETASLQVSLPEKDEKVSPADYLKTFDDLYGFVCDNLNSVKEEIKKRKK